MKREDISEAVGNISTKHIQEAESYDKQMLETGFGKKANKKHGWIKWGALAACVAVVFAVATFFPSNKVVDPIGSETLTPPSSSQEKEPHHLIPTQKVDFHLVKLSYSIQTIQPATSDFIIYFNPEMFIGSEQDGFYTIRPNTPPDNERKLPECSLKVYQIPDISPTSATELLVNELESHFSNVSDSPSSMPVDGKYLHADNGMEWDAKQLDVYVIDNLLGGSYIVSINYFTEAAEGYGVRFRDMLGTFKIVTSSDSTAISKPVTQLQSAINRLIPSVFSDRLEDIDDLLAEGANVDSYGTDVMDDISIASIDYTVDNDISPTTAVVSVKHRTSIEDSFNYLTVELSYADGTWKINFAGIEK